MRRRRGKISLWAVSAFHVAFPHALPSILLPILTLFLFNCEHTFAQLNTYPESLCLVFDDVRQTCVRSLYSPPGVPYYEVTAGRFATCAVRRTTRGFSESTPNSVSTTDSDGVDCFGDSGVHRKRPRMLGAPLKSFCLGEDHGCGIDARRQLLCWGDGPAAVIPPSLRNVDVDSVECGDHHTCVILSSTSQAVCFGEHSLSVPNYLQFEPVVVDVDALSPAGLGYSVQVLTEFQFSSLVCGRQHTCGLLKNQSVLCWGMDSTQNFKLPSSASAFVQLSTFGDLVCGLRAEGRSIECFGDVPPGPLESAPLGSYRWVATGERHICALRNDNRHTMPGRKGSGSSLLCWGDDTHNQVSAPRGSFIRIASGAQHSCAIDELFELVCWGQKEAVVGMSDAHTSESTRTTGISENLFL